MRRPLIRATLFAAALAALAASACGNSSSAGGTGSAQTRTAVLSAFPAEMAAVLDRATVTETKTIDGHIFRIGRIGGAPVVIGMTGVGLANAADTTKVLLDNFDVGGVVVSAVAGSPLKDGDVTVADSWFLDDGTPQGGGTYSCDPTWLDQAAEVAQRGKISLEHCAIIPDVNPIPGAKPGDEICFPYAPRVVVGGFGSSSFPFSNTALQCTPHSNDVFDCDTDPLDATAVSVGDESVAALVRVDPSTQVAYDEETAAIARETTSRGLPFVAFRASSDGGDDPLNLTGFTEFFAYYRLAAHNAATATAAFLNRS